MTVKIINGDCRAILPTLPADSFDCIVTSPPYWGLRDYGVEGQIGLEPTMQGYLDTMVGVCRELRRVLKPEGTFWLNVGDSYASAWVCSRRNVIGSGSLPAGKRADRPNRLTDGLKEKDLCMIPNRLAILLQEDGWFVRSEIIWHKPNPMPESVRDRPTYAHEKVWLLTKSERYFYDADAIREPLAAKTFTTFGCKHRPQGNDALGKVKSDNWGKSVAVRKPKLNEDGEIAGSNSRNVWSIPSQPYSGAHFATMPPALAERCIKAGCPQGGTLLDPFGGAGTTGLVADRLGRCATLIELNPEYRELAADRVIDDAPLFAKVSE